MTDVFPLGDEFAATYLQQMQALAQEMTVAINAISGNALSVLEESIARQEMLCASLATMGVAAQRDLSAVPSQSLPAHLDAGVAVKIRASGKAIRVLNLQYAALLKHSGKSIAVLSALCRNHTGQFQEARGPRLKHQTWSCEM
jgi:hypothetical protein